MFDYIKDYYKMPWLRVGLRISDDQGYPGCVTKDYGTYVGILLDGEKRTCPYHPTWRLTYYDDQGNILADYKETPASAR